MKKTLIIIFFGSISFCFSQVKSGVINYDVIMPDFDYTKKGDNELRKGMYEASKQIKYELKFNETYSEFSRKKKLITGVNFTESHLKFAELKLSKNFDYFFNKVSNKQYFLHHKYGFVEGYYVVNWEISQEIKKIDEYDCYKAIGFYEIKVQGNTKKREVEAWFAPIIPLPYGPKFYTGLPGLILELTEKSTNTVYGVTSIELYPDDKIKVNFPKEKVISYEEYSKRVSSGMDSGALKKLEKRKKE